MKALNILLYPRMIACFGRDRLEYFCSNTLNNITRHLAPFLWTYDLKALVLQRRQDTPDVVSFKLLPNTHWTTPQAGQFIEITYPVEGEILERAYSISTLEKNHIWLTVKRLPGGKMSNALHTHLKAGDTLNIKGPFGAFVYRQQPKLLLISAGSGITPCFSMVQALLASSAASCPDIQFYSQFSTPKDTIFKDTLQAWQRQAKAHFKLDLAYSQAHAAGTCPPITPDNFTALFPDFTERDIYLCGPTGFQTQIKAILKQLQFPVERLHIESFHPVSHPPPEIAKPSEADTLPEVVFSPYHCRIQMRPEDRQKSLLELGLEHGLNLEKGCQKGYCGSCKLVLHEGQVQGQTHGQAVYICSAYANSARVVLGY